MKDIWYRLDDNKRPVPTDMFGANAQLRKGRHVGDTMLPDGKRVSTVFLTINHQFDEGPPVLFETMVFGPDDTGEDLDSERYSTWEEAEAGHKAMVEKWSKLC